MEMRKRMWHGYARLSFENLESRELLAFDLVADLNATTSPYRSPLYNAGDTYVYIGPSPSGMGRAALWGFDLEAESSSLLQDFNGLRDYLLLDEVFTVGDRFALLLNTDSNQQIWFTDGTLSGTRVVAERRNYRVEQTVVGDKLFFQKYQDGTTELWATDGTTQGTGKLLDTAALPVDLNGIGIFVAPDPELGSNVLWRSDGTAQIHQTSSLT